MLFTESELITKRINRVIRNNETIRKLEKFDTPIVQKAIKNIQRCSAFFYLNTINELKTWYCNNKLCLVCNAIRSGKLINRYEHLQKNDFVQVVLTVQNFTIDETLDVYLKTRKTKHNRTGLTKINLLDIYQKFWNNSVFKKYYKPEDYTIIRTFEVTQNKKQGSDWYDTLHPHFHCLVISHHKTDSAETIGKVLINSWIKYMDKQGLKIDKIAQYCEPPKKNIQENFKYITKIKDASPELLKWVLENTAGRRLFIISGKRVKSDEDLDRIDNEIEITDLPDIKQAGLFFMQNITYEKYTDENGKEKTHKLLNYVNEDTGEIISNSLLKNNL